MQRAWQLPFPGLPLLERHGQPMRVGGQQNTVGPLARHCSRGQWCFFTVMTLASMRACPSDAACANAGCRRRICCCVHCQPLLARWPVCGAPRMRCTGAGPDVVEHALGQALVLESLVSIPHAGHYRRSHCFMNTGRSPSGEVLAVMLDLMACIFIARWNQSSLDDLLDSLVRAQRMA
jgi:hypothetical protein